MQFLRKITLGSFSLHNFWGACQISRRSAPLGPRSEGGFRGPPPPRIIMVQNSPVQLGLIVEVVNGKLKNYIKFIDPSHWLLLPHSNDKLLMCNHPTKSVHKIGIIIKVHWPLNFDHGDLTVMSLCLWVTFLPNTFDLSYSTDFADINHCLICQQDCYQTSSLLDTPTWN